MLFRCSLIFVLLLLAVAGRASDDWVLDTGLSRDDARVKRLLRTLDGAREEAIAAARARLGLETGKLPVEWRVTTRARDVGGAAPRGTGEFHAGETRLETTRVVVSIPAYRYLERPRKVVRVVVHEAAHAALASRAGSLAAYQRIPQWYREGIALWMSGEGTWRVDDRIALAVTAGRPPRSFLRGIAAAPTPAESFLAIEWIESRTGRGGIAELTKSVAAGELFTRALVRSVGLEERGIAAALRRHAESTLRGRVSDELVATFRKAVTAHRDGNLVTAFEGFERLATQEKPHGLRETSRYLQARTLVDRGSFRRARGLLGQALAESRELLWEPEILEQSGICALGLNQPHEADRYFHEVLERFPEDGVVATRVEKRLAEARKGTRAER